MCKHRNIASQLAGKFYMCRPCWRKHYRNKRKGK
jgi:hypothetical protein